MSSGSAPYVSLTDAVNLLRRGGVLVYPTETFFAVGCSALFADSVARVYQLKRRSAKKPLPLLTSDRAMVARFADLYDVPETLLAFWPAPLTLVLPALPGFLTPTLLNEDGKVAVRVTSHPVASALSFALDAPVTASSANIQSHSPARLARDVEEEVVAAADAILDLEPEPCGGFASTIVEPLEGWRLRLWREGAVPVKRLVAAGFTIEAR